MIKWAAGSFVAPYTALVLLMSLIGSAAAQEHTNAKNWTVCAPDGVALGGYDVVSYHRAGGPALGLDSIETTHGDLTYRFSTEQALTKFRADPDRYLPTYLGWCSTNLAMGRLACPDYTNFNLERGRLLLFEHAGFTNGRDIWNTDPINHKNNADKNFERFGGK